MNGRKAAAKKKNDSEASVSGSFLMFFNGREKKVCQNDEACSYPESLRLLKKTGFSKSGSTSLEMKPELEALNERRIFSYHKGYTRPNIS